MKRLLLISIAVSLSGCLSSGIKLGGDSVRMTEEHAQFIEKAGVVSLVDPQPRFHFVSSSLKESNLGSIVLDDWDATATVTNLMASRLRQKGFTVIPVDAGIPVAEAYSSSASFAEPDRLRDRLLAAGKRAGVDMLVVVYRQLTKDFVTGSSQKVIGYGLYKRHREDRAFAYSTVLVEVLNVNKGYVLGKADGSAKIELDGAAWQDDLESDDGPFRLRSADAGTIREKIIEALTMSTMIAAQETGVSN
jgi:hypothetical protein